ncbi:hypothetical protein EJB05_39443, partial [Eragrostis curvula]
MSIWFTITQQSSKQKCRKQDKNTWEEDNKSTRLIESKSVFITLNSTQRHNHSLVIGRKQIRALPQTPAVRPEQKLHFQQQPSPIPAAVTRAPLQ